MVIFDSIFPPIQYGFWKGHNTQNCILILLERWRKSLDSKQVVRMLLTDLSRRGAVVKGIEHISIIVLVNIWLARVRVPLVLSVGIWICKNAYINN